MTQIDPFSVTVLACIRLALCATVIGVAYRMGKRACWREDRLVAGFLALLALHQAASTLQDTGWLSVRWAAVDQLIGALIAGLFLLALALLRAPLWELHNVRMRVRISEMNMNPPAWTPEEIEALGYPARRKVRGGSEKASATAAANGSGLTPDRAGAPARGQAA